jgi:hypothetical protein
MHYFIRTLILLAILISCGKKPEVLSDKPSIVAKIDTLMNEQQLSWNAGDLEGFMKHYWKSDSMRFVGKNGISFGWQRTLDNYKSSYPDNNARGQLQFNNLYKDVLSDSSAFVIGKWTLFRTADTLSGHFTLLWKKMNGKWVIVADHSS